MTPEQNALMSLKHSLMDELLEYGYSLQNKSNKHRVYLAWKRLQAIKITDEK